MSSTTCRYTYNISRHVSGSNCGAAVPVTYSFNHAYISNLSRFSLTLTGAIQQHRPSGCNGPLAPASVPFHIRLDGAIIFTVGIGVFFDSVNTLQTPTCTINVPWSPTQDPGLPPTRYACINGVCVLASQGIYNTVEQCQATGCQAPGSPERPLSELCPEGESCDQNSTCVSNQDLNNWIQAINDMKTVIQG